MAEEFDEFDELELEEDDETEAGKYLTFNLDNEAYGLEITYVTEIIGIQKITEVPELPEVVAEQVEIFAKYEGYINKQKQEVEKALKLENKKIPADIDYLSIKELSSEAAEKLAKVKPASIGQASRISGVSPADVSVLMIALEVMRRKEYES